MMKTTYNSLPSDENNEEFLDTFEPRERKTRFSWLHLLFWLVGASCLCGVLYILSKIGHHEPVKMPSSDEIMKNPARPSKRFVDPRSIIRPIAQLHRCECSMCQKWRNPEKHPRMEDVVCGCTSHRMEWHQVTSKANGHTLPGPGGRFQKPGVICDICQGDFDQIGADLWEKKKEILHSWTCYKCEWHDPDAVTNVWNPETKKFEEKPVINRGVDICSCCARKAPEELQKFRDFGPEGKLIHEHHKDTTSLVGRMRARIKEEL